MSVNLSSSAFARRQAIADSQDFRVITKRYGGLLGPEYTVAAGGRYYRCGELTLSQLKRGIRVDELDLLEIDPDEESEL
ncbi:hypothetical protein [Mesorhizobium sp. ESP-6-2]|uniref:hypothetical protein n=1 Tax=Mesorhizobium sp. ESP-6-2 TaxID=2876625 RepID=UPI001CCDBDB3|nr:hypothetical protein [Mesorhizobium sp. ESP-6-2]MBZ9807654.1 hypothetical protein [Mesorhizobium sp. ESP-6-2]